MTELIPLQRTILCLEKTTDWIPWLQSIEAYARNKDVWNLCDPDGTDSLEERPVEPPFPVNATVSSSTVNTSTAPTSLATTRPEPTQADWARYNAELRRFETLTAMWRTQAKSVADVNQRIRDTLGPNYRSVALPENSCREILINLRGAVGYSINTILIDTENTFARLKNGPKSSNVESWISDWRQLEGELRRLKVRHITSFSIKREILNSARTLHPTWSYMREDEELNRDKTFTVEELLSSLAQALSNFRPSRTARVAFAAINNPENEEVTTPPPQAPSQERRKRTCFCGEDHNWSSCPLFNPKNRSSYWKISAKTTNNLKKALEKNPFLKSKVERVCEANSLPRPDWNKLIGNEHLSIEGAGFIAFHSKHSGIALNSSAYQQQLHKHSFILDSGADIHICRDATRLYNYRSAPTDQCIITGNSTAKIQGYGSINLIVDTPRGLEVLTLHDVALIPQFHINIISFSRLEEDDIYWNSENKALYQNSKIIAFITKKEGLYLLESNPLDDCRSTDIRGNPNNAFATSSYDPHVSNATAELWHRRLGHIGKRPMQHLEASTLGVKMLPSQEKKQGLCEGCELNTAHHQVSRAKQYKGSYPFEVVHLDLMTYDKAYNNDQYLLHFYCSYSMFNIVFPLKVKTADVLMQQVRTVYKLAKAWNYRIRYFHLDKESGLSESKNGQFLQFTTSKGISITRTPTNTKEPNGSAERSGGVIAARLRALLLESKLPANLWPEFAVHATFLLNRIPKERINWKTPYELVLHRKPSLAAVRAPGAIAYLKRDFTGRNKDKKTSPQALVGFYVGCSASNIFNVWIPDKNHVTLSRDVTIDESVKYDPSLTYNKEILPSPSYCTLLEIENIPTPTVETRLHWEQSFSAPQIRKESTEEVPQLPTPEATPSASPGSPVNEENTGNDYNQTSSSSETRSARSTEGPRSENVSPTPPGDTSSLQHREEITYPTQQDPSIANRVGKENVQALVAAEQLPKPAAKTRKKYNKKPTEEEVLKNLRSSSRRATTSKNPNNQHDSRWFYKAIIASKTR